ncbi:MAG: AAA family ATPase, partial [Rhodoferax sp.]|nr:AAA family ATPase [Rhodoferax sp.]
MPKPRVATAKAYTPAHLAQKILTSRSALEGERKQVTVLFCDMANSTELAHRLGADAMHALLNQFFALALAEVHRLEGTINQFLGDGFMALFGAPVAHEDHVRRALLSALGIRQKLKEAEAGEAAALSQLRVRMGVNTGMVVVGKIGDNLRMDYTAIGDTTNIAARLQQLAAPGQIFVSDGVHTAGRAYFDFSPMGKRALKGIKEPVAVFELTKLRPRDETGTRARNLGIGSPLVGRDHELALLHYVLQQLSKGQGGNLILTGEPGSGKSRLVAETQRHWPAGKLLWLEGRAVSFGRSLSYLPFIEILKECFDIADDDREDESWRKLESGLTAMFAERTPEMLPYLATVLALRVPVEHSDRVKYLDGPGLRRQVFLCMRQLFEQLALRQPVVLLLEDWHWADQSSIELAEHLLPLADSMPLLVFFATRPDPEGPTARIRKFAADLPGRRLQEIELPPLSPE